MERGILLARRARRVSKEIEKYEYYQNSLENETHLAYLIFDDEMFVGAGGISYFQVMPTYHNPTGRKAYIMNMYTKPDYRRQAFKKLIGFLKERILYKEH